MGSYTGRANRFVKGSEQQVKALNHNRKKNTSLWCKGKVGEKHEYVLAVTDKSTFKSFRFGNSLGPRRVFESRDLCCKRCHKQKGLTQFVEVFDDGTEQSLRIGFRQDKQERQPYKNLPMVAELK
jgi:hypothetical protein